MGALVPFSSPVVNPQTATLFRSVPYISAGEYRQAPTSVGLANLVPGGTVQQQEASLAAVIERASDWLDTICFHRPEGTLAATPTTDSAWVRPRENGNWEGGTLLLACNFVPILELVAVSIGSGPQSLTALESAQNIAIEDPLIVIPGRCVAIPYRNARLWVVWQYINGYPHTYLSEEAAEGSTLITVAPSLPGESAVWGVYEGTVLTIHDGENTEVVVVSSVSGLTLHLNAPLRFKHEIPELPNVTRVSAIPSSIEQACISLVSCLIKTRGSRAKVMAGTPGGNPGAQEVAEAGGLNDYKAAMTILKPFVVPVLRST